MKWSLVMFFMLFSAVCLAQKLPDLALYQVHLTEAEQTVVAEIDPVGSSPKIKPSLFYNWYSAGTIHRTQGGFSGTLLNGNYTAYYLNKNLKEQGLFKKGLKDGDWKSWNEDGTLKETVTWKNGLVFVPKPSKFWQKLKAISRKHHRVKKDSALVTPPKLKQP